MLAPMPRAAPVTVTFDESRDDLHIRIYVTAVDHDTRAARGGSKVGQSRPILRVMVDHFNAVLEHIRVHHGLLLFDIHRAVHARSD